jgi:heptosyltransferase-2
LKPENKLIELNLKSAKKILIVRLSSLGDVILTTPLLRSLKKCNSSAKIDFIVRKDFADILKFNPYLQNLFLYEKDEKTILDLQNKVSMNNYDIILDLQNNFHSSKLLSKCNLIKLKFNKRSFHKFMLVHFKINNLKKAPQIPVRYVESFDGFNLDEEGLELIIPHEVKSRIENSGKVIGFCPASKHFTKMWLKEYFIELGNKLAGNGFTIALFGGKQDRTLCKNISLQINNSIDLSTENDLLQTARDMQNCLAIVCNDSGLMHTACAVKVPVVAIFGSTVKEFGFFPYKNKNRVLENNFLSCRPCSHIGKNRCPKNHFKCMKEITPEIVYENVIGLINVHE